MKTKLQTDQLMRYTYFLLVLALLMVSCARQPINLSQVQSSNIESSSSYEEIDEAMEAFLRPFRSSLEATMSRVIAYSAENMIKDRPESKLTNLISDLLLEEGRLHCRQNGLDINPQVAFVNYGGLRSALPKGPVRVQHVYELMPFENEMVFIQLSGSAFRQFAQVIASKGGDGVAGVKFGIRNNEINSLFVGEKPFDDSQTYWVVTSDYIGGGGDGMSMFAESGEQISSGKKIRTVILEHFEKGYQQGDTLKSELDGRIYYE